MEGTISAKRRNTRKQLKGMTVLQIERLGAAVDVYVPDVEDGSDLRAVAARGVLKATLRESKNADRSRPSVLICFDRGHGDTAADRVLGCLRGYSQWVACFADGPVVYLPPPLILTLTTHLGYFKTNGFAFPDEFLLDLSTANTATLLERIHALGWLWAGPVEEGGHGKPWAVRHVNRFHADLLRDLVVGHLRRRLGLDERHHDASSPLIATLRVLRQPTATSKDLNRAAGAFRSWAGMPPKSTAGVASKSSKGCPLDVAHLLFGNTLDEVTRHAKLVQKCLPKKAPNKVNRSQLVAACLAFEGALPRVGGAWGSSMPALRPRVLLVDDQAEQLSADLKKYPLYSLELSGTQRLGDLLSIHPHQVQDPSDAQKKLKEALQTCESPVGQLSSKDRVDLVLLDLSLNESEGEEPGGLQLIELFRDHLPAVPVMVFSSFDNVRHVIQAVRRGASWYCHKADPGTVLRSLVEARSSVEWEREWKLYTASEEPRIDWTEGCRQVQNPILELEEKYLLAKLCGRELVARRLGGGIGGAKTLRIGFGNSRSPVVVKLDQPFRMLSERERYRRFVHPYIANRVGRIDTPFVQAGRKFGGITYSHSGLAQGRSPGRSEITSLSLKDVLKEILSGDAGHRAHVQSFSKLLPVLEELFDGSLATLHAVQPPGDRRRWRERFFGEASSLRESAELRVPATATLELMEIGCPLSDATEPQVDNLVYTIPVCYVEEVEDDAITVVSEQVDVDGRRRSDRFKLVGPLARHLAKFRVLRPLQHMRIVGTIQTTRSATLESFFKRIRASTAFRQPEAPAVGGREEWANIFRVDGQPVGGMVGEEGLFPFSNSNLDAVLALLEVAQDRVGIVHGDLNVGNVMLEQDRDGGLSPHPWLIDFARTRRDAIAHDFVELEVDLVSTFLRPEDFGAAGTVPQVARARNFLATFDRPALELPLAVRRSGRLEFLFEAVSYLRRKAAEAGVLSLDYQSLLYIYYLIVFKLKVGKANVGPDSDWPLIVCALGGNAALSYLKQARVRVSVNSVARVGQQAGQATDTKFLLRLSSARRDLGVEVLTPFARTLRAVDSAVVEKLKKLGSEPERPAEPNRLCYSIGAFKLPEFEFWYRARMSDEARTAIVCDVKGVVGQSIGVVWPGSARARFEYRGIVADFDLTDRIGVEGTLTRRLTHVVDAKIHPSAEAQLKASNQRGLALASADDIERGFMNTPDGKVVRVGAISKAVLRAGEVGL